MDIFPRRKTPRADFHDYSGGDYFITICTHDKKHYFGNIADGKMNFTDIGRFCNQQLEELTNHYPYADMFYFVVMPNHIHALIHIDSDTEINHSTIPKERYALSVVVGGLKRSVSVYARKQNIAFGWQRGYHDRIVRNPREGSYIADYIRDNVARWDSDCFHNKPAKNHT